MPKITKVEVDRNSEHADYSLSWETPEARFHVWLTSDGNYTVINGVGRREPSIYKNPLQGRGEPGHFDTRYLKMSIGKNKLMFDDARAEAVAGNLFTKCDAKLAQEEKERLAQAAAEYKVTLAQEAGPEMLKVLKAIAEFWKDGQQNLPLAPGAMIFDGDETIVDVVRKAVWFAETGGAVPL